MNLCLWGAPVLFVEKVRCVAKTTDKKRPTKKNHHTKYNEPASAKSTGELVCLLPQKITENSS